MNRTITKGHPNASNSNNGGSPGGVYWKTEFIWNEKTKMPCDTYLNFYSNYNQDSN